MTHFYLIVLYGQKLSESMAYCTLRAVTDAPVLIYDNSPVSMLDCRLTEADEYYHDPTNPGLATAYRYAVERCREQGVDWLTLFDQDTSIPSEFVGVLDAALQKTQATSLVPRVELDNGKQVSPFNIEDGLFLIRPRNRTLAAINSGNTLNISALGRLGDVFDDAYPLDFLDYDFFKRLNLAHATIELIDVTLKQQLSVSDYRQMSTRRIQSFYEAESRFVRQYYAGWRWSYRVKVGLRLIKAAIKRVQLDKLLIMTQVLAKGAVK